MCLNVLLFKQKLKTMMCFHQPAPNDGEDGRLLLLLLSALHFINLKSLFVVVVVVAADITHLKAQASL